MGGNTSEMIIRSFVYRRRFEGSAQTNLEVLYKHCARVGKNEHVWYVLQLAAWYSIFVYCTPPFCQHCDKLRVESKGGGGGGGRVGQLGLAARQMGDAETMFKLSLTWLK